MIDDNSTTTRTPKNPSLQKLPEAVPDRPSATVPVEPDAETLGSQLTSIYDELYDLLAISEFTQNAVEKLMAPEDTDYSHNLVMGLGQTFGWLQCRGQRVKTQLHQAIGRVNTLSK